MSDREKRCEERYDLELPVMVKWQDGGGRTREAPGTARNISPLGAFLVCVSPIGQGCAVDLDFDEVMGTGSCLNALVLRGFRDRDALGHWLTMRGPEMALDIRAMGL
ncbi:MAG: hypothetical protein JRF64_06140 [Deltaproteobacteria bacterium]|nr:hypothetical protein [Deltaproteobacteria bacterium]